jgi:hypothetical protein
MSRVTFGDRVRCPYGRTGIAEWGRWEDDRGFIFRVTMDEDGEIEEIEARKLRSLGPTMSASLRRLDRVVIRNPELKRIYYSALAAVEAQEAHSYLPDDEDEEEQPKRKVAPRRYEIWHRADGSERWRLVLSTANREKASMNWIAYSKGGIRGGALRFVNPEDITA